MKSVEFESDLLIFRLTHVLCEFQQLSELEDLAMNSVFASLILSLGFFIYFSGRSSAPVLRKITRLFFVCFV